MKTNRYALLAVVVATLLPVGSLLAADIVGNATNAANTNGPKISVGESVINGGPHKAGYAGIGVSTFGGGAQIDLDGIAQYSTPSNIGGVPNLARYQLSAGSAPHGGLGNFDFVRVASADVWFGTWNDGTVGGNYQAYYVGDRTGTTLPTGQTATYTVAGLNNSNVLTGTLTATFGGTNKLIGALSGNAIALSINANINSDASFNGYANANGTQGTTNGSFFGANAASLAGIAEFSNTSLNTAFGGTKNP